MTKHDIDFVISPTSFNAVPPKIEDLLNPKMEEASSPISEYKQDFFTAGANSLGIPAVTIPLFESEDAKAEYHQFPSSIRLQGYFGEDFHLLRISQRIDLILQESGMSVY